VQTKGVAVTVTLPQVLLLTFVGMPECPGILNFSTITCRLVSVSHSGGVQVSATASANSEQPSLTPRDAVCADVSQSQHRCQPQHLRYQKPVVTQIPAPIPVSTTSEPVVTTLIHQLKGLNDNDILMSEPIRERLTECTDPGVVAIMADLTITMECRGAWCNNQLVHS
jgi:hypothetical protein